MNAKIRNLTATVERLDKEAADALAVADRLQRALYRYWPPEGVRLVAAHANYEVGSVAFHPGGRVLAAGYGNGILRTWDPDSPELLGGTLASLAGPVHSVAFSPTGDLTAVASDDGTVRLIDSQTGEPAGPPVIRRGPPILAVAFAPPAWQEGTEGDPVLATCDQAGEVRVWRLPRSQPTDAQSIFLYRAANSIQSLAFSSSYDPSTFAIGTATGQVMVWARYGVMSHRYEPNFKLSTEGPVKSLSFRPRSNTLAVSDGTTAVRVLRVSETTPLSWNEENQKLFNADFPVSCISWSPDSSFLAVGGASTVILRNDESGPQMSLEFDSPVQSLAFRPDGQLLAVGLADGIIQLCVIGQ